MKRPLVISAIALIWGIILADVNNSHVWGMITIILSILIFLLLYRPVKHSSSKFILFAIPFLLCGYLIHSTNESFYYNGCLLWEGESVTVNGAIFTEPEFKEGKTRFLLSVKSVNGEVLTKQKELKLQITIYKKDIIPNLKYGSVVTLSGEIKTPLGRRNFGGFDTRKFLASREVSGTMSLSEKVLSIEDGIEASLLKNMGYNIKSLILGTLNKCLPQKESSVIAGMLIGYTADMPEEMEENFRRSGLSHVMAVSGANIAFLLLPLLGLLKKCGFNPRWYSAFAFPLMLFYVFATGMEASVVRAAIMAGVTLIGMILWRKTDIYCSMAVSAMIILFNNSFMLYDLGFILSFAATLSLVIFYKPIFNRLPTKIPKVIRDTLAGTIAAQLGVIPVIAYYFNTFSIISVLSNLLIVPLTGFITILGALLVIVGSILVPIGKALGFFTLIVVRIMLFGIEIMAKIPWAEIKIATPSIVILLMYYIVLLYLRYGHPKLSKDVGRPLLAGILSLCGVIILFSSIPNRSLQVYFADVGQGDCAIIRTPQGKNIIIDGGGSINDVEGSYAGERIVVPLLYNLNMLNIDIMIASHGHADHIGGLHTVLDKIKVNKLIVADASDIEMYELIDLAEKKGISIIKAKEGDTIYQEENLLLKALYPLNEELLMPSTANTNANELSLVTKLEYGEFSALFTGDIGFETEKRLLYANAELSCNLLKVAHHGSKYSTEKSFIRAVSPNIAVISVGKNRYGHPSPDVLKILADEECLVYQTFDRGGILVEAWKKEGRMRITTVVP